jgi:NADH-quinone oxidoreductase subunit H
VSEPWWISAIKGFVIINIVLLTFAYTTLLERKALARMQLRYGPNRAGPYGLLQPIADLVKLVRKESFFPTAAIDIPYILAPIVSAFTALAAFAVIPWGKGWEIWHYHVNGVVANVPISLILIFALGSIGIYGFIVGGWASESKFSLLGSMRTCAQLVSYEVSLALSVLGVVITAGSLSLVNIVDNQANSLWYVVPQAVGFLVFVISGVAETSRAPFDLPEAEQELVAGYHTEYSGMRWGLFQLAEYVNLITLFLGGWHFPFAHGVDFLGPLWFFLKLLALLFVFIWLRATLPRLRYDQLMSFGWKILLPVATVNAFVTALVVVWVN